MDIQKRQRIADYFKQVASQESSKVSTHPFEYWLDKNDKKRVILIQPESAGDCFLVTSLFKSIRNRYPSPEWTFYVSSKKEYKEIFDGNPYVDKWIEYTQQMDNHIWLIGNSEHKGYFNVAFHPYFRTQRLLDYLNDGISDKIDFNLNYEKI